MNKKQVLKVDKAVDSFFSGYFRDNNVALSNALLEPALELLKRGGKRWRPLFMNTVYRACGGKKDISFFYPVIELIHNGTLVHDDIEDSSEKRRGKEAIHRIYGTDIAINLGAWMYFAPFHIIKNAKANDKIKQRLLFAMLSELENCHKGQAMDIYWHRTEIIPSEKDYFEMCALKTGSLARMAARFGVILAGKNNKTERLFSDFATSLGIAFQIQDDILNMSGRLGKEKGDDITEGKKSLPVICCLQKAGPSDKKKLLRILKQKTKNKKLIDEAVSIMVKYNSLAYANQKAKILVNKSWKKIKNKQAKNSLKTLKNFVTEREF